MSISEAFQVPLCFVNFFDDATLRELISVHAARPCFLSFAAEAINLILASVVAIRDCLLSYRLLQIGAKRQLWVVGYIGRLLNFVDLAGDNGIDDFISACWQIVACLRGESSSHIRINLFLLAHCLGDVLRELLGRSIAHSLRLALGHEDFFIGLPSLRLHWLASVTA